MTHYKLAGGVKGVVGVVEGGGVKAVPGGEIGGRVPRAEEVECELSLGEKGVPKVKGEVKVGGGEGGDKVILERANRTFRRVSTVILGGDKLDGNGLGLGAEKGGQVLRSFIVGNEGDNGEAEGAEEEEGGGKRLDVCYTGSGILWFYVDIS